MRLPVALSLREPVPTTNSTANVYTSDVVGSKADAAVYVPGSTASLEAYVKALVTVGMAIKGSVTTGTSNFQFSDTGLAAYPTSFFNNAIVLFLTGANALQAVAVNTFTTTTGAFSMLGTFAGTPSIGDQYVLVTQASGITRLLRTPAADSTNNNQLTEVTGSKADTAAYVPGTTKSLQAYAKGTADLQENVAVRAAAVFAAGTATLFTIAGGPIEVLELLAICATTDDATATLLKFTANATVGGATDVCAASASLGLAAAGTSVLVTGVFAAPPTVSAGGTVAGGTTKFIVPAGTLQSITTGGATTGTWTVYLRYRPLAKGVTVT